MTVTQPKLCVGVLGGMGPYAALDFCRNLLDLSQGKTDQSFFRVILDNNPDIPDRNLAISGNGATPEPILMQMATGLERMGADFIVMPCNTAHTFYAAIAASINIPIINMVTECCIKASILLPNNGKIGLLTTTGSKKSAIYDSALQALGIPFIYPNEHRQRRLMELIYRIKTGNQDEAGAKTAMEIGQSLIDDGASIIISGCTELSLVLSHTQMQGILLDSAQVLAERTVAYAFAKQPLPKISGRP